MPAGHSVLARKRVTVSFMGVRGVWTRCNLQTKHERLMRLEQATREKRVELSERQIRLLECFSPEFRGRHIITKQTGELLAVGTFYVGQLKGVGKVYLQTVIDCFSRHAWGRLYTSKLPITPFTCSTMMSCHSSRNTIPSSPRSCRTTGGNSAGAPTPTRTNCSSSLKRSNTAPPACGDRNPTVWWNAWRRTG